MRLCFYNPQVTLGKTLFAMIFGNREDKKYSYLLDFLRDKKYPTVIMVDGTASSLTSSSLLVKSISNNYILIRFISLIEIYVWCLINHIPLSKTTVIFRKSGLDEKKDTIFGFANFTDTFINEKMVERSVLKNFKGVKIFHVSHFFSRTKLISGSLRKLGVKLGVAEADVKKSDYFNKYFDFIDSVYVLPFILRDRYKTTKDFEKRSDKCFATGADLVLCTDVSKCHADFKEYADYFGTGYLQPMRHTIYENREELKDIIDCYISPHSREYSKNKIVRIYDKIFRKERKTNKYYSFNIVDKYNEYKMFVAPEENVGLPSVNFVEGMACGCAYIGLKNTMYDKLGLVDGVNYIGYDGTLGDLRRKIEYYSNHEKELGEIARKGNILVKERFSEERVKAEFWNYLESLI